MYCKPNKIRHLISAFPSVSAMHTVNSNIGYSVLHSKSNQSFSLLIYSMFRKLNLFLPLFTVCIRICSSLGFAPVVIVIVFVIGYIQM